MSKDKNRILYRQRFFAVQPRIYRLPSCKLAAMSCGINLSPTQYTRDEGYLSQELGRMRMSENQLGSVATGSGGIGTHDTTLIERVELSSFVAGGDRLLVHLNSSYSSYSTACLGDSPENQKHF